MFQIEADQTRCLELCGTRMMSSVVDDVLKVWPTLTAPIQPHVAVMTAQCRRTISKEQVRCCETVYLQPALIWTLLC
jgi:hypothetical protein